MTNRVHCYGNKSLAELEIVPGEYVAFNNDDVEYGGYPFLICVAGELKQEHGDAQHGDDFQKLIFAPRGENQEYWNFYSKNKIIGLWKPENWNGLKLPRIITGRNLKEDFGENYVADVAYAGNEAVKQGLIESGLESYCEMFGL